jgi:hypothetical protein
MEARRGDAGWKRGLEAAGCLSQSLWTLDTCDRITVTHPLLAC